MMRLGREMRWMLLALGAMFMQQSFASLGRSLPTVIAPAIIEDLAIDPAWVGVYVSIAAFASLVFQLGCGSFIIRYGALRMSQVALVFLAGGLAFASSGLLLMFALSALIGGGGAAMSTPASSHLLGRYTPPRIMPLVFSVKQTAVPAGLLLSGLLGPAITHWVSWRAALDVSALACLVFALMLQPLAREFDSDRDPSRSFHFSDFATTLTAVLSAPELRRLSMACFAFNGLQTVFTSYFIILLTEAGYGLSLAGLVFSIAMMVAVPGRILWGWMGSSFVAPRAMMGALALGMAVSSFALAFFGAGWPVVVVGLVASALSATAMSWHGVLLAEAARLAPHMRGAATGGVLSFGQVGALFLPLVFAGILWASGSYGLGFAVCGLPALVVGIVLLRPANAQTGGNGG